MIYSMAEIRLISFPSESNDYVQEHAPFAHLDCIVMPWEESTLLGNKIGENRKHSGKKTLDPVLTLRRSFRLIE